MGNLFSKLGKKIETAINNAYPVGTTYYGGMSGAGNMNLAKIEYAANKMDPDEAKEFKKEANAALGVGTAAAVILPFVANGIQTFRAAHPIISGAIDAGLTVDGVRNALSDNGVKKTWNYIKDGNWGRAAASGTMDALDLLGGVGLIGDVIKGYNYIKPSLSYLPKIKINGIYDRGIETILRTGVLFGNEPRILKKLLLGNNYAGLKYIMGIDSSLAYNMPFKYSGNGPAQRVKAHPGDMIDVLMGKSDKLLDESGNVIGSVTNDASSVPSKYLEWLKSIQNTKEPRILDIPYYLHQAPLYIDGLKVFDIFDKGIPIELGRARSSDVRVQLPGPYKDGYKLVHAIDPWKHGVGVSKINNLLQGFGWDVYHYTPMLYLRTNSELARGFKIGKLLPITAGKPLIVQWKKRLRVGGEKSLLNTLRSNLTEFPFKADDTFIILEHVIPFRKSGGTIKIKKKNRGKFTASAKAAGEGVQEHAHKVMNDPNATPLQKKRANFAIQAKKWHRKHQLGGKINYLDIFA